MTIKKLSKLLSSVYNENQVYAYIKDVEKLDFVKQDFISNVLSNPFFNINDFEQTLKLYKCKDGIGNTAYLFGIKFREFIEQIIKMCYMKEQEITQLFATKFRTRQELLSRLHQTIADELLTIKDKKQQAIFNNALDLISQEIQKDFVKKTGIIFDEKHN